MQPSHPSLSFRSGLMYLAISLVAAGACAQTPLSQEEKLEAIRHSLIQAAMEGPTRVQATTWIDAQGALRESNSFRTGMQVRGVKVLSYARDNQGAPRADVTWQPDSPTAAASGGRKSAGVCPAEGHGGRLQHLIGLRLASGSNWQVDDLPLVQSLRHLLLNQWQLASDKAATWRMAVRAEEVRSAYEQALLGSSADDTPWQASLTMHPVAKSASAARSTGPELAANWPFLIGPKPGPAMQIQLNFSVTQRKQRKPVLDISTQISVHSEQQNWASPRLTEETRQQVALQMQAWTHDLQQQLACEPVHPEVTKADKQEIRINAGSLAGVRVGDEWLLGDGQRFPKQILEPGVAEQTVLARVETVSSHHAQLKLLAGPLLAVRPDWRAWPTETPR